MDVPLPPEIEQVVLAKVAAGEYPSVAVLIEEALFLLVERDWQALRRDVGEHAGFLFEPTELTRNPGDQA